ncbi:MAG: TatD family hydrolase [Candidatus Eremiobacteraeota bacterium]|nr:TatD family hydrolase [Candidatus Eremiobacteraeota bacterium]
MVDTHAHIDGPEFVADRSEMIARARDNGVRCIISAGQDEATSRATLAIAAQHPEVWAAIGVHPHMSDTAQLEWLAPLLHEERVVAVGEMGLDYHYNFSAPHRQREVFAAQLEMAGQRELPVIIHCREAYDDLARMLSQHYARNAPAVIHCFTESYDVGKRFIEEFDVMLGIGGAVTFKNAHALHDAAARLPLEHLVLETDCPFMTPAPYRGKRNEPGYIKLTAAALARLRGCGEAEIAVATTRNAKRLFPKLARHSRAV